MRCVNTKVIICFTCVQVKHHLCTLTVESEQLKPHLSVTNDGNNRDDAASSCPCCVYLTAFSRRHQLKYRAAEKCAPVCGYTTAGLFFGRFNPLAPQAPQALAPVTLNLTPTPDWTPRS